MAAPGIGTHLCLEQHSKRKTELSSLKSPIAQIQENRNFYNNTQSQVTNLSVSTSPNEIEREI